MAYLRKGSSNHSLTTFPVGHVIQTVSQNIAADGAGNTATGTVEADTGLIGNLDPTVGNKILIKCNVHCDISAGGGYGTDWGRIFLYGGATSSPTTALSQATYGMGTIRSDGMISFNYFYTLGDAGETAGNTVYFKITMKAERNYIYVHYTGASNLTLMEIQQ